MSAFWFIPSSTSRSEHLQQSEGEQSFFSEKRASPFFNGAAKKTGSNGNGAIQAKLTVGPSNDAYEKEADTMADKVVQRQPLKQYADQPPPFFQMRNAHVQRKCAACEAEEHKEKEDETVQPKQEALVQKCDCDKEDGGKNKIQEKHEEKKEDELVQP